jgi:hypothetical protein
LADDPTVLILPTTTVAAIRQYLGGQPHDQVDSLINVLEACIRVQMPHAAPPVRDECPAVTQELARRALDHKPQDKKS